MPAQATPCDAQRTRLDRCVRVSSDVGTDTHAAVPCATIKRLCGDRPDAAGIAGIVERA